jgi:hypothetical protein
MSVRQCCGRGFAFLVVLYALLGVMMTNVVAADEQAKARARDVGIPFDGAPGPLNAITVVAGVEVGHVTLIRGEGKLESSNICPATRPSRGGASRYSVEA